MGYTLSSSQASCGSEPSVCSGAATTAYSPLVNWMPEMIKVKNKYSTKGKEGDRRGGTFKAVGP